MFKKHYLVCWLVVAALTGGALAQDAAPTQPAGPDPNQPAAESVYKRIPADCLGFVAAKNVNTLLKNIEKFADQIGMGDQIQANTPGGLLPMMVMSLQLGEGFNPNGGAAFIVMDLEKCGLDIDKLLDDDTEGTTPPFVILLAGKNPETAFPKLSQKDEAGNVTVILPMGDLPPLQTMMVGDYIAMSPNPKALALMKTDASIEAKIPAGQKKLLADAEVVLHENVVALSPLLKKVIAKAKKETEAAATSGPANRMNAMWASVMGPLSGMLDDILCLSYGFRFDDDGMLLDMAADYKPDSELAKLVQTYKPTDESLMNRLPNLPYVLAGGMKYVHSPEYTNQMMKLMEMLLAAGELEMPADLKERMITLSNALGEEVTEVQFVGGAPKDKGVFGLGMVIACKDADKTKALLPQKVELITELIQKTVAVKEENLASLTFTYKEGVEKIGDTSVDAVVVDFKELQDLNEKKKKELIDAFGEDTVRFLVAKVDDKTLAVTIGGSTDFLAAVLQSAKDSNGTIPTDPGVVKALAKLPKQRVAVMVFSAKNLFDTIQAGMKKMDEPSNLPEDFKFENDVPMAMTSTVQGTTGMASLYLPSAMVKDAINWFMAEALSAAAGSMPPPAEPVEGESDF